MYFAHVTELQIQQDLSIFIPNYLLLGRQREQLLSFIAGNLSFHSEPPSKTNSGP